MDVKEILKSFKDNSEAFQYLKEHGLLKYCPRLHLSAINLPCGQREECFCGHCEHLPKGAKIDYRFNAPFPH